MSGSHGNSDRKGREGAQRTRREQEVSCLEWLGSHCTTWWSSRSWRSWRQLSFVIISFFFILLPAQAKEAAPLAADPALEARVMRVAEELRCLVCQNETIAASQAELAVDLRRQVREKLRQGESEAQVLDFMVQRYGEFVRYRPAFNPTTAPLWIGPFALLALAAFVLAKNIRRRRADAAPAAPAAFSEAEQRRLAELLSEGAAR